MKSPHLCGKSRTAAVSSRHEHPGHAQPRMLETRYAAYYPELGRGPSWTCACTFFLAAGNDYREQIEAIAFVARVPEREARRKDSTDTEGGR